MTTYNPLPETKCKLASETVAREKKIHALQVRYGGVSLQEKKAICDMHRWKPEETIPELKSNVRVSIDALSQMVDRNENNPEMTHKNLQDIIKRHKADHEEPQEAVTSTEYWFELADILFEDFDRDCDPEDINFKEVQRAYADFFGV